MSGPSQSMWRSWYPFSGKGKGKAGKGGKGPTNINAAFDNYGGPCNHDAGSLQFPPLGMLSNQNWEANDVNDGSFASDWRPICNISKTTKCMNEDKVESTATKSAEDGFERVRPKRTIRFRSTDKFNQEIHEAMTVASINRFGCLKESGDCDSNGAERHQPHELQRPQAVVPKGIAVHRKKESRDERVEKGKGQQTDHSETRKAELQDTLKGLSKKSQMIQRELHDLQRSQMGKVAYLTRKTKGCLATCVEGGQSQWKRLAIAVDSGACDNVINPEHVNGHAIKENSASANGMGFISATGEEIPNLGEAVLPIWTRENTWRSMQMQAAEVVKPLASVAKICRASHKVVFDDEGSYIMNKETGETQALRQEDGNYMLDVWVPPSSREAGASGFHGQP